MKQPLHDSMNIVARDHEVCAGFARAPYFPLVVKRGRGSILEDADGKEYIDLLASAAAINTGHCHPTVVEALRDQVGELIHYTPGYVYHELKVQLAEELVRITPGKYRKRVAFGLSGSDSIDGMIKLVRAYTMRPKIVSFVQAYHGSTYGALSLTALSLNMRRSIGPLLPEVHHINYPDCYRCDFGSSPERCSLQCLNDFRRAMHYYLPPDEIAAVVMEPIAGDAGFIVPPKRYMQELHSICRQHGILFVVDEVQQGFGRTGKWFCIEHFYIEPDIIVMGKSIASGIPMSAIVGRAEIMEALDAPGHLFTTGGSPVACRAALATISVIESEQLVRRAADMGSYMQEELKRLAGVYDLIGEVRGLGLTIGVDLVTDRGTKERAREAAAKICYRSFERGVIVIFMAGNVLRIQPPLVITKEQVDKSLDVLEHSIRDYLGGKIPDEILNFAKGWGM
ncbi:MAG: Isoleucine 2-epimerase [Firmicutes bacterium]|nr:Isoleucine 2-epimerase [candidate division NPL-UPA2 bacterium]MBT9136586.1 Isoleucine 2-epimerase [Bacillota bacterium]